MTKFFLLFAGLLFSGLTVYPQTANLPVKEWNAATNSPYILYISGDGGLNSFSTGLCTTLNKAGYSLAAVNAKTYFWEKRTPEQTARVITSYLEKKFAGRNNRQLVLAGYSFGADVLPFIINKLPESMKKKLVCVMLLSPSASTDFEIHLSDMLGIGKKRSMNVMAEINRMGNYKTVTIFGSDEHGFPVKSIKLPNYVNEKLSGGHHYEGNINEVVNAMIKYFK
jgi:type IV secretory pathway VirJ component